MTQHDVIIADGELSPLGDKKPSRGKRVFGIIGEVVFLTLFTLVLSVSGQITYDYARYSPFFVNGMSMYPTLNRNVYRVTSTGETEDQSNSTLYNWGNFDKTNYTYYCDYGMFDAKQFSLSELARFDILVTYFKDDMVLGSDGKYVVKTKASSGLDPDLKIKRLIAFPGESFYFDSEGDLWIKAVGATDFEKIDQPFLADGLAINAAWKKQTLTINGGVWDNGAWRSTTGATLGANEYFVCGDNRLYGASSDSRYAAHGPVPGEAIQGKAVTLIGRCSFRYYSDGTSEYHPLWNSYKMPWALEWL